MCPRLKGSPYGETPIRHLLTMSSGVKFSETYSGFDDVATLAKLSLLQESEGGAATVRPFTTRERPAGQRFSYSSAETQVLGLVLRGATGETLAEYASRKLWQPMGAEADASWVIDRGGYEVAFAFFNATLRDYARLGVLLADDGMRDGRAIIPASWVRAATTPSAPQFFPGMTGALFGYGYQTWIIDAKEREFLLRGLRGQGIYVAPKSKIVMVHTAVRNVGVPDVAETLSLWNGVVKSLAPAVKHAIACHVPDRVLRAPEGFVEKPEVVMRVGEVRIGRDRRFVGRLEKPFLAKGTEVDGVSPAILSRTAKAVRLILQLLNSREGGLRHSDVQACRWKRSIFFGHPVLVRCFRCEA